MIAPWRRLVVTLGFVAVSGTAFAAKPAAEPASEPAKPDETRRTVPSLTTATPAPGAAAEVPAAKAEAPPPAPGADEGRPDSVEIQVRRLTDKLAAAFNARPGGGRYERWAVVPFNELGEEVTKRHLGEVVASQIEGALKTDHGFICVERLRLAEVVKELQLAQAGLFDESKAPKVGEMAGADVLVVGSVGLLGSRYVVNARVVSAGEGKVLAAAQTTIEAAGLVALSSEAVVLRTRSDAVFRSALIPGWGQMYNRQEQKGGLLMFASGALLAGGLTFYFVGNSTWNEYEGLEPANPGPCANLAPDQFTSCVVSRRELAYSRWDTSTALFVGLGVVYVYNVFDAWFFGYKPDASTKSLYSGVSITADGVQVRGTF